LREARIEGWLRDQVRKLGGLCLKFVSPGNVGVPDRIIILSGHVIFVELKTDTGRLSPKQVAMHRIMQSRGADVRVVYGMDEARQLVWDLERMLE
jgi:hypothetical protein